MSKHLLSFASPFLVTPIRMIVAGLVLLVINLLRNKRNWVTSPRFWLYNSQVIIAVYAKYMLRYWGLDYMPASKMAFLLSLAPFVTALFSFIVFHERLSKKQWLGLLIGFIGMIPIIVLTSPSEQMLGEFFYLSWAELSVFAAVCINSYAMIFSRILVRDHGQSVIVSNSVRMLGGGILAAITALFVDVPLVITKIGPFIGWMSVLIITSNLICHNFHLYLYKFYTPTFLSFTDFLSPLFTAIYSWYFLHEVITWHYGVSAIIVFCGLYLFYQDELKTVYIKPVL
jgi:drug/metabolite transporter (DMT)-like permease